MKLHAIKFRLREDFQLTVITLLGLIGVIGVTPFAVIRLIEGEWAAFALDVAIELSLIGGVLYAWISHQTHRAGLVLVYVLTFSAIGASFLLGLRGTYWLYPALLTNFFLIDRRHALAIALMAVAILLIAGGLFRPPAEAASFVATVLVSSVLTYVFAFRTSTQREQLEALANRDPLTGVYNRRSLLEEIQRMVNGFQRDDRPCGLLVLDLDHFKLVNDRLGHMVGDQVLIRFARLIERSVRPSDRMFRFGGEEFVLLVPATTYIGLQAMATNLREAVQRQFAATDTPVTVSIGGAVLRPTESAEAWFERADTALYSAKNAGRNAVVIDPNA